MHCSWLPVKRSGTGTAEPLSATSSFSRCSRESPSLDSPKQKKGHVLPSKARWGLALQCFRAKLGSGNSTQLSDFTCITVFAVNWG